MDAVRYALAHVIANSKMDMTTLDIETLMDVFAILPDPKVGFEAWNSKRNPEPVETPEEQNEKALRSIQLLYGNKKAS